MDWIPINTQQPEIKVIHEEYGFRNVEVMLDDDQIANAEFQIWNGGRLGYASIFSRPGDLKVGGSIAGVKFAGEAD